jgi:hypothetical protein
MHALHPFIICAIFASSAIADEIPAFPGAEGEGANTPGGRGGTVFLVTSLEDAGPGSLREACEAEGPRIIIINVNGIIELESPIDIANPFVTVAGQKAPGDGICLKHFGINITTHDVIVRYLRIRPGDEPDTDVPGLTIANGENIIIDHCSISWTTGPTVSISGATGGVTLQWCLLAESLFDPDPEAAKTGVGITLAAAASTFSIHHNYIAHHHSGIPYLSGATEAPGPLLDFNNNIVYDWGVESGESANNVSRMNLARNVYKAGPSTAAEVRARMIRLRSFDSKIYFNENDLVGSERGSAENFFMLRLPDRFSNRHHNDMFHLDAPFSAAPVQIIPTETVLRRVLGQAGANQPRRDEADTRVIGQYHLDVGRLINVPLETGGWPEYEPADILPDTDADGMADEWERLYGLSPTDPSDSARDEDKDGYTNVEEYLNSTPPAAPIES